MPCLHRRLQPDDGAIQRATLLAQGAKRVCEEVQSIASSVVARDVAPRGHARARLTLTVPVPAASSPLPPRAVDVSSDEDPFGHALLGFDEGPAPRLAQDVEALEASRAVTQDDVSVEEGPSGRLSGGAHRSHALRRTAHIIWSAHCGRHAATRLGVGLLRQCRGTAEGAYPARVQRLKAGLHPTSGCLV